MSVYYRRWVRRKGVSRSARVRRLWELLVKSQPGRVAKPRSRREWAGWGQQVLARRAEYARRRDEQATWDAAKRQAFREWDTRVQAAKTEAERTGQPVRLPAAPDFGESGVIFLNVDDPRIKGYVEPPEPAGLTEVQRQRRALADRLAEILTSHAPGDEGAAYTIGSLSLPARVSYARLVREALVEAPEVADASEPGAVKIASGVGGVVLRLHGSAWSLVFRYSPYPAPVLFVTDDLPDQARRVDDDADWQPEITAALDATVRELSRYSWGGDKYLYRPLRTA